MRLNQLLFALYLVPLLASAQLPTWIDPEFSRLYSDQFQFDHFTKDQGLINPYITKIQKQDGFLWLRAGGHQLIRFDGSRFVYVDFYEKGKLLKESTASFFLDSGHRLWIGASDGMYLCANPDSLKIEPANTAKLSVVKVFLRPVGSTHTTSLLGEDTHGNLWITHAPGKLYRFNFQTNQTKLFQLPGTQPIVDWWQDQYGSIWVLSEKDVYLLNQPKQIFEPLSIRQIAGIPDKDKLTKLFFDKQETMWLGTDESGTFQFRHERPAAQPFLHQLKTTILQRISTGNVSAITQDGAGRIWIGTTGYIISIYEPTTHKWHYLGYSGYPDDTNTTRLNSNFIGSLLTDEQGIVWVGFLGEGLDAYNPTKNRFRLLVNPEQAINPQRKKFASRLYFAKGDSLYIFDGHVDNWQIYSMTKKTFSFLYPTKGIPESCSAKGMVQDETGRNWIVSHEGLCTYNPRKRDYDFYPYPSGRWDYRHDMSNLAPPAVIHKRLASQGKRSEIWLVNALGLIRFDIASRKWLPVSDLPIALNKFLSGELVHCIRMIDDHTVCFGAVRKGLARYNLQTGKVDFWYAKKDRGVVFVKDIVKYQSSFWVATDEGLFELATKDLSVKAQYSKQKGDLPDNYIFQVIRSQNGHFWLSSNLGLIDFMPGKGTVNFYKETDEIQNLLIGNHYEHTDGTLYMSGYKGITYFNPKALKINRFVPPIKITGITVMDSSYAPNLTELSLPHDQNFITFDFVALNFASPEKNQYQYQLKGVDDNWVKAGTNRTANYTKLAPGTYVFTVIGSNNDGIWNKTGASVTLTIRPPWWGTWWFRVLLVVLLAAGIYGLFRYRLQQILRQREAEIKASLMAQESERQRFSRELHDGVGANLSLLKMYLSSFGNPDIPMDSLKDRSESLLASSVDDIRRLIHDMHPRNLQELGLVRAVEEMVQVVNLSKRVQISFMADALPQNLSETVEINLYRIIQELLQNAVKHARATHIGLQLTYQADKLQLSYSDNGQGFDPGVASSGNGLLNIRNRVELLKGKLDVQSSKGEGTRIQLETKIVG